MKIIVCIKQVPDTEDMQRVKINRETNTLIRESVPGIINPFDENAIEEALRLKEKKGGKVTVVSMGPSQAEGSLRKALAMGVDEAVLLSDRLFAGSDTLATSYTLAVAIKRIGEFDLILLGKQAIDGDTAQVGPELAEWLNLPQITYARKIEVNEDSIRVERVLEDAFELVESPFPALVTVTKDINEPRYPSLRGLIRAKAEKISIWTAEDLPLDKGKIGLEGSATQVVKVFVPEPPRKGDILSGEISQVVDKLILEIEKRSII